MPYVKSLLTRWTKFYLIVDSIDKIARQVILIGAGIQLLEIFTRLTRVLTQAVLR